VRFGGIFDYDVKAERLHVVNAELEDPNVWNDPKRAQELGREKKTIEGVVDTLSSLAQSITDSLELF
jgi:peptide chain release factor 2